MDPSVAFHSFEWSEWLGSLHRPQILLQALGGSRGSGLGAKRQSRREFSALWGREDRKQGWFGINGKG
jgi:hypothetical protein